MKIEKKRDIFGLYPQSLAVGYIQGVIIRTYGLYDSQIKKALQIHLIFYTQFFLPLRKAQNQFSTHITY